MTQPTVKEFLKAGYPSLFLRTIDAQGVEKLVRECLKELNLSGIDVGVWKATSGLYVNRADDTTKPTEAASDLLDALGYVEKTKKPIVAIFYHVRQFVNDYQIIQQTIDAAMAARLKGSHILFVGPHLDLPVELKNLITYVDIPLPKSEEIETLFTDIVNAYAADMKLPSKPAERQELIKAAANAAVGLDMMGAENSLALSLACSEAIDLKVISSQKEQEVRKSDVLEFFPTDESMDTVGGMDVLKEWLRRRKRVFTPEARAYGLPHMRGILIVGPGGTGKSLLAKATSHYLGIPLLRMDMGRIFRSLVGESEAAVRIALDVCEAVSPIVLWMDEIDKGLAGMKGSGELDSGVTARVVSTILTWRQETTAQVVLACTANDVATIPSILYRKGRMDEVWATDLPYINEREEIFRIHLRKRHRDPEAFDVALLAENTDQWTGSEIEANIEDAMFSAFDKDEEVTTAHILQSIKETVPMASRNREELKAIREWVDTRARRVSSPPNTRQKASAKVRKLK